ncbi:MAG: hypothetical protein L7T84_08100 [Akkermansiaceae bacterium]|nr:hypothetical protein [Akkermansiaceae bacterium]
MSEEELFERYLVDELSDDEKNELAQWLDEDSSHRARFREFVELESFLGSQLSASDSGEEDEVIKFRRVHSSSRTVRHWERMGVAALLLLSLTLGWMLWSDDEDPSSPERGEVGSVVKLSGVSEDVVFAGGHELPTKAGSLLGKGWIMLERGSVDLEFHCGATVELTGPAVFGIDSALRGFLESGGVKVHAPEGASGFVIGTENMEVVDLGTRFEMSTGNGAESEVKVTEGRVDLHTGGDGADRKISSLAAGLEAVVSETGEIVSVGGEPLDPESSQNSGLLAHWKFDDASEGGSILDDSGHDRHALFRGRMEDVAVAGRSGGALRLDGDDHIDISEHIPVMMDVRSFTFATWVKDASNMVFSFSDGTPRNRVQFELWGNLLVYGWQQGPLFDAVQGRVPGWKKGQWQHVAVMVSGREVTLYVDGRYLVSRSVGHRLSSPTLTPYDLGNVTEAYIGFLPSNHNHKPQRLGGMIDDVQFYGRALDERAIRYLFENAGEPFLGFEAPRAE